MGLTLANGQGLKHDEKEDEDKCQPVLRVGASLYLPYGSCLGPITS